MLRHFYLMRSFDVMFPTAGGYDSRSKLLWPLVFDCMKISIILNIFSICLSIPYHGSAVSKLGTVKYLDVPVPNKRKIAQTKYNFMSEMPLFVSDHLKYHMGHPVLTDPVDIFCKLIIT
jgi:hypothetical protein